VLIVMLVGANLITANVVRNGLRDLFERRLDYAGEALRHYANWHLWSRWNELRTMISSPRFVAAVSTQDSSTISQEAPAYLDLLDADLFAIGTAAGAIVYGKASVAPGREFEAMIVRHVFGDTVVLLNNETGVYEVFLTDITTSDGFNLGRLAAGYDFNRTVVPDIGRLTGFDALITSQNRLIGQSPSTLSQEIARRAFGSGADIATGSSNGHLYIDDDRIVYRTNSLAALNCDVTFLASIDEHIDPILNSQLKQMFLLALGAGALAIAIVAWFIRRNIGGQVNLLVEAAGRIARDDMDFQIRSSSKDEFGYLAAQFDQMRSKLLQTRRDLEKAHEERIRTTRLAAIGQLAAGIIHDFKNPVAIIRGTAELLSTASTEPRSIKWCHKITDQVDRITELTRDILEYSRGRAVLNLETVGLEEYLGEILKGHEETLRTHSLSASLVSGPSLTLRLDRVRFRRVLDNLIGNAAEALSAGGSIRVGWALANGTATLSVADNGPGVPAQIIDTLFEPFVTSGKAQGTGLGLAISKKIVEEHGGTISVASEPGAGACFAITIPHVRVGAETVAPEEISAR